MKSNNLLYHYTDIYAAIGILKSGVLFFSHCRHPKINDLTEFKHADPFILETIKKAIDDLFCGKNKYFDYTATDYEYFRKKRTESLSNSLLKALGEHFFAFSTTQHHVNYEKDNGSLVMWRGYGKKNGCSIVFDKNQLESIVKEGQKQKKYGGFICDKVKYLHANDKEKIEKAFRKTYADFYESIKIQIIKKHDKQHDKKINKKLLPTYFSIKSRLKHYAFNSEQEYRIGILRCIDSNKDNTNLIEVKNGRIELPIAEQGFPIKKIIVSPIGDQEKNYKVLSEFIQSDPRYHGIEVTKSEIPHQ
jgi:hypothetical protein